MSTSSRSVGDSTQRGSVGALLEARNRLAVGFDVETETCHVLPDIAPIPIAQWQDREGSELYNVLYDVLGRNAILSGKSGKKGVLT